MISFKDANETESLEHLISKTLRRRVKRHVLRNKPNETVIQRIFGPTVTANNFTMFAVDPPTDFRIIHELKKYDIAFSFVKYQWENYDLPNKQIAMLRAIREGELRKQYIRELRQNGEGERQADLIRRLEKPTELFDQDLIEEFGPARLLSDSEKREWRQTGQLEETRTQNERERAGQKYVQTISEISNRATENRGNAQLNSRVQFVTDKIIEASHHEFNKIYRKLCELQNTQIEITRNLLTIDPTLGMRTLLKRSDIVAKRAGEVYMVNQCRQIEPEKIHYDHKVKLGLGNRVQQSKCTAKVANGTQMTFLGKIELAVTVGVKTVSHQLLIVKNGEAPAPCLLGIDFITLMSEKGWHTILVMRKRYVLIGGATVNLLNPDELGHEEESKLFVVCEQDENIPPRCQAIISGKIPEVTNQNDNFIVSDLNRETEELYSISSVLSTMNTLGQVVLKIYNPGNSELKLRKNMKIAQAEFFRENMVPKQPMISTINQQPDENWERPMSRKEEGELLLEKLNLKESNLSEIAIKQVEKLIKRYPEAFVGSDGKIGKFRGKTQHYIELNDNHKIPQTRPYRLSPEQKEKLEKELEKMRRNDLIEESTSPYTSPILMVPKPNGDTRIVIDYRKLNLITRPRTYIMPHTTDVTEDASRGKIFSVFDICQGFHHIRMYEPHKERTAFCCHLGVFHYKYMPMGLKGSPDTFQRAMSEVARQFSGTLILYVDDLTVVSDNEEQHIADLEEFFKLMIKMGLKLKAEKSQIGRNRIKLLGFVIENRTIQPSGEKTEAIRNFPIPKNVSEVKSFLGMSGYFRRFIKDYAILAKPLTALTQKENSFKWGPEQQKALDMIKDKLISPPILTTPDMNGDFEMHTDASKIGIAAILFQKQENQLKVVAYASRPTTKVEQRYPPIELESLAITWGLTHYRPYIFGRKVKVVTDHQPLKALLHRKENNMSGRLMRHEAIIQQYDVEIVYRPGRENHVADALSRQNVNTEQDGIVASIEGKPPKDTWTFEDWKRIQNLNPHIQEIKKSLLYDKLSVRVWNIYAKYIMIDGVVHMKSSNEGKPLVLLDEKVPELDEFIMAVHNSIGHAASEKTKTAISKIAVWNKMKQRITNVVSKCKTCQMRKHAPEKRFNIPMGKWAIPARPFERIHMDVIGPLPETKDGNQYIIAAVDAFSKFAVVKATQNQTSETSVKFLMENIVGIHGIPLQIVTDQGRNFISQTFKEISEILQLKQTLTPAYHHQSNGIVERFNRTVEEMLTCTARKPENFDDWDRKLPVV
ncbi:hypothetical protein CRE_03601, partial [Caenorhabditis remanei]